MKLLTNLLSTIVTSAFTECGYDAVLGQVAVSDRLDLCQFQCNGAFSGAKLYKKPPLAIANEVVSRIQMNDMLEKAEVVPPGFQTEHPETIVLDYGNPNVAKPLHVGHLRSAIIGEALKRIIISTGRTAIGDVHLGDWGLPMGLVLAELEERHGDNLPPLTVDLLNEIYPFASKKSKADGVFLEKARKVTAKLQKGDARYTKIWREMVDISIKDIRETFGRLNVSFDHWYGESDSSKYVPELIKILTDKKLLVQSEGAEVVNVAMECDKAVIPPTIIVKLNGSEGYATTDIATILQRQRDFKPDKILYVVDFRQNLHFTQVFRTARKAELIPNSTELAHLCFGTVNGRDGKPFKTREGGVMQLSELLDTVISCSYDKLRLHEEIGEADKIETAKKIGIAAIKFGDLINHYSKDCIFDMEKFMMQKEKQAFIYSIWLRGFIPS